MKQYGHNGLAGCVSQSKSRKTRTLVGVYHAEQAGMDCDQDHPWVTVCETHGSLVGHGSLSSAKNWAPDPTGWCDDCRNSAKSSG